MKILKKPVNFLYKMAVFEKTDKLNKLLIDLDNSLNLYSKEKM
jgi:hypothetical protein